MTTERNVAADDSFRRHALNEAARYGSDPWVFVRELLQNARDAGARRVVLTVSASGETAPKSRKISCRDDGCGMTFDHARRFLFALYASSKDDDSAQAGKFGVGFWSVLRLSPSAIWVRSRARSGDAWQVSLDGSLRQLDARTIERTRQGTEVVLELPEDGGLSGDSGLVEKVFVAARKYGRFLMRREDGGPLQISVNGRSANAEFALSEPSRAFRGKSYRGVVGLGTEPQVELFAQGLFVRSGSSLQDLQANGESGGGKADEDALAGLPSLAPRVLIDSERIDLLLARSEVRHDKHMRQILSRVERELGCLVKQQLQALRPQPWYRPLLGALRERLESIGTKSFIAAGLVGLLMGLSVLWWVPTTWLTERNGKVAGLSTDSAEFVPSAASFDASVNDRSVSASEGNQPTPSELGAGGGSRSKSLAQQIFPYADLAESYQGPQPGGLGGPSARLMMTYEPRSATPFFNALVVDQIDGATWSASATSGELPPYRGTQCRENCIEVTMLAAASSSPTRIPIPTGYRLEVSSLRLGGESVPVYETFTGEPVLMGKRSQDLLQYRVGPAPSRAADQFAVRRAERSDSRASSELEKIATHLADRPIDERVSGALDYVARRVVYDRSPRIAQSYAEAVRKGSGFIEAALFVGAGDCDVQNGVLASLLDASAVEARLVLGFVGTQGTAASGLHAWVEYRDDDGRWSVADASLRNGTGNSAALPRWTAESRRRPSDIGVVEEVVRGSEGPFLSRTPGKLQIAVLVVLLTAAVGLVRFRKRQSGITELSSEDDLAALLGGALRHPEAFAGLPAMFHGRFVPLIGRHGALSLHRARHLANADRLFASSAGSPLAHQAAVRGNTVVDADTAEGRLLTRALGAVDLDRWSSVLADSRETPFTTQINRHLASLRSRWCVREARGLSEPWVEIALDNLRLGQRSIVIDREHLEFAPARCLLPHQPEAAAFAVLDVLAHRLEMTERSRARLLAASAETAIVEFAASEADS